jgi:hypothetical protein
VATTVVFSVATSRYLYVKAKEYNQKDGADPVSVVGYGAYGLLCYVLTIGLIIGVWKLTDSNIFVVPGIVLHLFVAGAVFARIKLHLLKPLLILAGFALVTVIEVLVWLNFIR